MKACDGRAFHSQLKQLCAKMSKDQQWDIQRMPQMMKSAHGSTSHNHQREIRPE